MPELTPLDEFFNGDLFLPWKDKKYRVAEPTAEHIENLRQVILMEDPTGRIIVSEGRKLLGPTWNELIADGIGWASLIHMTRTALFWFAMSPDIAAQYWHLGQLASMVDLDTLLEAARGAQNR